MIVILDAALIIVVFTIYGFILGGVAKWLEEEAGLTAKEGLIVLAPPFISFFVSALALIPGPSKPFGPFVIYILYVALLRITVFLALTIIYSRVDPPLS